MLISREKRKTNIAEYILYMWQVEDTIRAFGFDIDKLAGELIDRYDQPPEVRKEIREWNENIAAQMKMENVVEAGHIQPLKNIVNELYDLHLFLLRQPSESLYSEMFARVLPLIREMDVRQGGTAENEIETCLNAVYVYMMMRLKKVHVSTETNRAMEQFIRFLAILSKKFREMEESRNGLPT